jgi:lipopolysaccharide/colanic/teichoic acid biosynthesis glycosyltransferase
MLNPLARQREPHPFALMGAIGNVVVGGILLLFVLPLILLVAVWISCDSPGPVFEMESQIGPGGRRLRFLKFRTSRHVDKPVWFAHQHRTHADEFLHYTRLEYLPNLVSVAHGDVGLAGLCQYHRYLE